MKKVIFKWISTIVDYTSEEEAKKDIKRKRTKNGGSVHVQSEGWTCNPTFEDQGIDRCYTVEYYTRYNDKYLPGF